MDKEQRERKRRTVQVFFVAPMLVWLVYVDLSLAVFRIRIRKFFGPPGSEFLHQHAKFFFKTSISIVL
jgi:hypothetical protein